jgi:hypothetical protein
MAGILAQRASDARTGMRHSQRARPQRLFTVEQHFIPHSVGKVTPAKFDEVFKKARALFVD